MPGVVLGLIQAGDVLGHQKIIHILPEKKTYISGYPRKASRSPLLQSRPSLEIIVLVPSEFL
jgi:hypothetical protein